MHLAPSRIHELRKSVRDAINSQGDSTLSSKLLHMHADPADSCVRFTRQFATPLLAKAVLEHLEEKQLGYAIASNLREYRDVRKNNRQRGDNFEYLFHSWVQLHLNAGTPASLDLYELGDTKSTTEASKVTTIALGAKRVQRVFNIAELPQCAPADLYVLPINPNFPVMDSLLGTDLFQLTLSDAHSVAVEDLNAVLSKLPEADEYRLVFVVPPKQGPTQSQNSYQIQQKAIKDGYERVGKVKQYVAYFDPERLLAAYKVGL